MNVTDYIYVLVVGAGFIQFDYWFADSAHDDAPTARLVTETGALISDELPAIKPQKIDENTPVLVWFFFVLILFYQAFAITVCLAICICRKIRKRRQIVHIDLLAQYQQTTTTTATQPTEPD